METLWDLITYFVAKYQKTRGGHLETLKNARKKSHSEQKNRKWDPLVSSGFVGYVKEVKKMKGGPFALSFCLLDLALVVLVVSFKSGL